jgi:hypothetical protein
MSKNNTNKNPMDNLIRQNINCHSQCDDQIHYYNISTWTKKSFSRNAYNDTKLIHKSHCLLHNESLSMAWKLSTHVVYKLLFVLPSLNGIPFLYNYLRKSTQSFIWYPACLQNLQTTYGTCPFWGDLSLDSEEEP